MTAVPFSRTPDSPVRSLAELAEQIAADESLAVRQRQEMRSALRTVGRAFARRLEEVPAHPRQLRERLTKLTPAMAGVSAGRWANVMSLTRAALKHAGLTTIPGRSTEPLAPEWRDLFRHLNDRRMREGLSRFARYCSRLGISPTEVSDAASATFLLAMEEEGLIRNPRPVHRVMCVAWNRAAQTIAAWPPSRLTIPQYKQIYSFAWTAFPPSLRNEVITYFDRLSSKDILDGLDFRPLRPASIQSYDRLLRAYLSALVRRGRDPQTLRTLADVVTIDQVKDGLRFFLDRAGGKTTKQAYNIARMLTALARHWVKVDPAQLEQLRKICRRLDSGKGGMTEKNRDRLRQFDDPANLYALLSLPHRIFARQKMRANPSQADALAVQSALAVELLLIKPMRIGNLAGLDLERNILRTRSRGRGLVHLVVSDKEVKNAVRIEAVLPSVTVKLLDLYTERYRPLLMRCPSSFLFPNTSGGPKSRNMLGLQITKFVRRECGLQVNAHLFRHIGAAHYLNDHPGAYGLVQLVLGHTSEETTKRAYCGTETAAAMRHFDEHVLRLRAEAPPLSNRKARRTRRTG